MYKVTRGENKLIIDGVLVSGDIFPMHAIINGQRRLVGHMAEIRGKYEPKIGGAVSNGIESWVAERVDQSANGYTMLLSSI
ncbi:hypothetical protein [Pontibaca salina]|uniref:Uncharacterized protein n=1 Tax=Pontibaca salina TaxID=2795731 RepID=A0A934HHJ6_9RHOB|nr:hypothetical protein [Pontibaca salina]MBI6628278.1 hypothetical protein [Pontibaca salina]